MNVHSQILCLDCLLYARAMLNARTLCESTFNKDHSTVVQKVALINDRKTCCPHSSEWVSD